VARSSQLRHGRDRCLLDRREIAFFSYRNKISSESFGVRDRRVLLWGGDDRLLGVIDTCGFRSGGRVAMRAASHHSPEQFASGGRFQARQNGRDCGPTIRCRESGIGGFFNEAPYAASHGPKGKNEPEGGRGSALAQPTVESRGARTASSGLALFGMAAVAAFVLAFGARLPPTRCQARRLPTFEGGYADFGVALAAIGVHSPV